MTSHFLEEHFHAVAHCPVCKSAYDPLRARIVTAEDGVELVHVECPRCYGAIIATVGPSHGGTTAMLGMVTDLTVDDLFRLRNRVPVTTDNVLSFYAQLRTDNGVSFLQSIQNAMDT